MYHHLLLLCFLISSSCAVQPATEPPTGDPVCALVHCGQGTCIASLTGFDCECYPGWKKIQIGFLTFPACVIPNCTIDLQCGTTAPSPPPPSSPPPPPPPPANPLDPCTYTWCGDGKCVATGLISTVCQCNQGSTNLFNNTSFPCFNPCSFGIDCVGLGIEVSGQPSPPPQSHSGSKQVPSPNCSSRLQALTVAVIAAILLIE